MGARGVEIEVGDLELGVLVICRRGRGAGEVSLTSFGDGSGDFGDDGFLLITALENERDGCGGDFSSGLVVGWEGSI